MTRSLLAVLLLSACAPTHPSEYQQGAFRPAHRPPAFTPSQDAPHTVGQPGHVKPLTEYPRSPHKRPLPPTAEPTIYGGDEPKAAVGDGRPELLGYPLPYPDYAKDDADHMPYLLCGMSMHGVVAKLAKSNPQLGFATSMECMSAALLLQCMKDLPAAFPEDKALQDAVRKAGVTTIEHYKEKCKGAKPSHITDHFIDTVAKEWWKSVKAVRKAMRR
jgi:hypothetical protein